MLSVPSGLRIYLYTTPTDMRKGFDGLSALVSGQLKHDPLSGELFIFVGRRRDRVKLLYWDRDGLALWYKRLEQGTFHLPTAGAASVELSRAELGMLLEGLELAGVRRRPRYQRRSAG